MIFSLSAVQHGLVYCHRPEPLAHAHRRDAGQAGHRPPRSQNEKHFGQKRSGKLHSRVAQIKNYFERVTGLYKLKMFSV